MFKTYAYLDEKKKIFLKNTSVSKIYYHTGIQKTRKYGDSRTNVSSKCSSSRARLLCGTSYWYVFYSLPPPPLSHIGEFGVCLLLVLGDIKNGGL
jgi:hypothetical protein